ncbi:MULTISPECIES: methionyl aminopeptidase [Turicibacter]|jgi:methionine aminopeptidase, type I|uniref:methionyl aminopeptidase n=1 Tax=Turicibacter TaxID=191303 RepID=UPI0001FD94E9|nr:MULTISPECIES: methionyl aminopeptidase [Turicibacter]KAB3583976.1 methionyl aminopeptidase [Phocaeicola vulgatus]EGC91933.1 methionine aminopeptidase, type I [Turicibacter sp. HGF1]MCU7197268.1 methionyl aminopeptidase [Turicibacter sanguinis]MCU7200912.1 methionyl aminopeptidase [Turicibacter sanguinis]MDB8541920.1 methionyl aminopeptidase [Turicibacter sanguinis]
MSIQRNAPCWCGSGKKYKQCHLDYDRVVETYKRKGIVKTPEQIEGIRRAGIVNTKILDRVAQFIKAGISTEEINTLVHNYTIELGGTPAPLNYQGFPKSTCTSINDVVCHGIPCEEEVLEEGDIINVDVTTIVDGYYADASRMFTVGTVSKENEDLIRVTKECLELGLAEAKPGNHIGDIGAVIEEHAEKHGYTVVAEIGGHGVGVEFHEEPFVPHVGKRGTGPLIVPGMTFTIEPMINMGRADVCQDEEDGWTIFTEDGMPSAQWEYTILITEDGNEILTH